VSAIPRDFPQQGLLAMKPVLFLTALVLLAACGADGPPVAPSKAAAADVAVVGQAQVGIVGGN
jgi:predicted small lipoprotein YifL